jgi:hypothetical protein
VGVWAKERWSVRREALEDLSLEAASSRARYAQRNSGSAEGATDRVF